MNSSGQKCFLSFISGIEDGDTVLQMKAPSLLNVLIQPDFLLAICYGVQSKTIKIRVKLTNQHMRE